MLISSDRDAHRSSRSCTLLVFSSLPLSHTSLFNAEERKGSRSNAVQGPEEGLLIRWEASKEGVEVGNHALVLLDDLVIMLAHCTPVDVYSLTFWKVSWTF
jgi:hypothetical protein